MVHHAAKALAAVIVLALAAALLTGCGEGSGSETQVGAGPNVGAPINLADCTDWNNADSAQRLGTIQDLKNFAGGPVVGGDAEDPHGTGAVLDDKEAYDLFNRYCAQDLARGFKLYKLYVRAAAFSGAPGQP